MPSGVALRALVPPVELLFDGLADPRCILLAHTSILRCVYPPKMDRGDETSGCVTLCALGELRIGFTLRYHSPSDYLCFIWEMNKGIDWGLH